MVFSDEINGSDRASLALTTRTDGAHSEILTGLEALSVVGRQFAKSPVLDAAAILGRQMASSPVFDAAAIFGRQMESYEFLDAAAIFGRQMESYKFLDAAAIFGRQMESYRFLDAAAVLGRQFSNSPILNSLELLGGATANPAMRSAISVLNNQTVLSKIRKNAELLNRQLAAPLVPQIENMSAATRALTAASVAPSRDADTTKRPELFTWFSRRPPTDASLGWEHLRPHDVQLVGLAPSPGMERSLGTFDELVTDLDLRQVCRRPFADGYYSYSVELAYKCLNNAVKDKSGLTEADGVNLMRNAFSANNPILRLNGLRTTTEKDEQRGYMELFAGAMAGIRNPRAHEHNLVDPPGVALELLVLANHLMRILRRSTLSKLQ